LVSAGVGPKVDCSRKRTAAAAEITWPPFTTLADNAPDVVEPGFGFVTVTATFPACDALAVPVAVSSVADTNMVVSACPAKFTFAPLTNLLPVTVSMNGPTPMLLGFTALNTGVGFTSVIVADAFLEGSATLVAVIVIVFGLGTTPGGA
jgi:hypothetical protein